MQTVLLTSVFERDAKQAGLDEAAISEIVLFLAANPASGDIISGAGGARKVRFARKDKGKSGGYRTVHYFGGDDVPVFVLALIDKSERANISKAERNELAEVLPKIADKYRKDSKELAKKLRGAK